MKRAPLFVCVTAVAILFASSGVLAAEKPAKGGKGEEKTLAPVNVPRPVLDAIGKMYPKAKVKKFARENEGGKEIIEVELINAAKEEISVDVSLDGRILAEETTIQPSALPAPVRGALQGSKYKTWKIIKAEKVIHEGKDDAPEYEVLVQSKKEKIEVVLDKDGKITKEEPKAATDND
jgi:hypothetical protein